MSGARTKSFYIDDTMITPFYKKAAKHWDEPTFLSENGVDHHILFFDLDMFISADDAAKWTDDRSRALSLFIANEVGDSKTHSKGEERYNSHLPIS